MIRELETALDREPTIGTMMIWVSNKRRHRQLSPGQSSVLEPVWILDRDGLYRVLDEEGRLHNVTAARLVWRDGLVQWLKEIPDRKPLKVGQQIAIYDQTELPLPDAVREEFRNLPEEVKAQLSRSFREQYGI